MKALSGNIMSGYTYDRETYNAALYIETPVVAATITYEFELSVLTGKTNYAPTYKPTCKVQIVLVGATTTYYDDATQTWSSSPGTFISGIKFQTVNNINELQKQSISIKNVPGNGDMTIRFYAPYRHNSATFDDYFYFAQIELTGSLGDNNLDGQTFLDFITDDAVFIPENEQIRISDGFDNPLNKIWLSPYYNGFIKVDGVLCSNFWGSKSQISDATYMPLVSDDPAVWGCIMDSWWWQYGTSNRIYHGEFIGTLGYHNVVKFTELSDALFLLNDVEIDLKRNIASGTFIELKSETPGAGDGSLSLKARSIPNGNIYSGSGILVTPGGEDGELQFKSGGDFDGTTNITFDPVSGRLLKGGTLPLIEYRRQTETTGAGEYQLTWDEAFDSGDVYSVDSVIWGLNADGVPVPGIPFDQDLDGFKINFGEVVTFVATAMIER